MLPTAPRPQHKRDKLQARRQAAAEHALRTADKLRTLEAEGAEIAGRSERLASVGSLEAEREQIAKLQVIKC